MPAIYISKYNRFVDNVITRINRILGKNFDPVRVKLQSPSEVKKAQKQQQKIKNQGKGKGKGKGKGTRSGQQQKAEDMKNKMAELPVQRSESSDVKEDRRTIESEAREPSFVLISKTGSEDSANTTEETVQSPATSAPQVRETNVTRKNSKPKRKNTTKSGNKNKNKTKQGNNANKNKKKAPKAKATLFGLSSIKRDGDVVVNMQADHTTVKSNFVLGPLTLRVEREYASNGRRELKSATATTAEMFGRINLKLVHGGAATLHSIRVLQPKQVRIDSPDDHDKTREFLWKRSAHIASMVSSKLANAARSMLKPPLTN
ncbi:unnamed protein product [Acanthoscelides obtectus]|uniref:Uncharacterized protein n=2 Tax=Acanthoscelides obtectus TaxID=200917 RepID=A0A9P0P557_ACAOB|nr:unnamed protein product [Acanthoscelides obtectus]CAK1629659.1 hypothetical protein AOBTE_LOCUS5875 [Acanthoscelides obtectus]